VAPGISSDAGAEPLNAHGHIVARRRPGRVLPWQALSGAYEPVQRGMRPVAGQACDGSWRRVIDQPALLS
jgi:hypothetical protein